MENATGFKIAALVVLLIIVTMVGYPPYNVWSERLAGEAALARANGQKEILVTQARAEKEAATLRAGAIEIVGKAAQDFPEYRQQEFIGAFAEALHNGKVAQIIYVPTEFGIPVLQSGAHRAGVK